jgi:DNA invertase Pin-like site-specific DNA recombinase
MMNNPINPTSRKPELPQELRDAIALLRVSTDAQDLARQRTDLEKVRRKHNLRYVRTLELHGISGTAVLDNAQVLQVLNDLDDPTIEGIGTSALDRVFRPKDYTQVQILDRFARRQKYIWSAREGQLEPWTDAGWEQCMNLATRAGAEWRELRRRSIGGKLDNAAAGHRNNGNHPLGYRHDYRDLRTGKRASLIIYEPEVLIVRDLYTWCISGLGVMAIAKKLNLAGILSPRAGQKNPRGGQICNGKWDQRSVYQILTNPIYRGWYMYPANSPDAVRCDCPAIVTEEVWAAAQLQLQANKDARRGPSFSRRYLLTSLAWCLECGHRITTFPQSGGRANYRCGNIDRHPPMKRLCDAPAFPQKRLETAVWNALWEKVTQPDILYRMIETSYLSKPAAEPSPRIPELEREVAQRLKLEARAYDNVKDPDMPREESKRDWQRAQSARQQAEFELSHARDELSRQAPKPTQKEIAAAARELAAYQPQTFEERRAFLRLLVHEIRISRNGIHIECILPESILTGKGGPVMGTAQQGDLPDSVSDCTKYCNQKLVSSPLNLPISFPINVLL